MPSPNNSSGTRKRNGKRSRSSSGSGSGSGTGTRSSRSSRGRSEYEKSRAIVEGIILSGALSDSYIHNIQGLVSGVYGEIVDANGQIVSYDKFKINIGRGNAMAQHVSSLSEDTKQHIYSFLSNIRKYDSDLEQMLGIGWNGVQIDAKSIAIEKANKDMLEILDTVSAKGEFAVPTFKIVFEKIVGQLIKYDIQIATDQQKIKYYKDHFTESDKARFLSILSNKELNTTSFGKKFVVPKAKKQKKYI